jgi:VWFA-related protein
MQGRTILGAGSWALIGVWTVCALTVQAIVSAAQQPGVVFRAFTEEALIHATVVDSSGHLVTNLAREDFEVRVGGRLVPLTTFSREPQAITAVLLIETSFVLADRFFQMRDAAIRFVDSLAPGDRVRIASFGHEIGLSPWLTDDKAVLKAILAEELWPLGGATPLLQAVDLSARSLYEERRPTTILVLGVGGMTGNGNLVSTPLVAMEPLRRALLAERMMVHSVRFRGLWGNGPELSYLARESGGGDIEVELEEDLDATFQRIADGLRRQYLLGFSVEARDDRVHRLEVRVPGRRDLTIRAPRGYVARPR